MIRVRNLSRHFGGITAVKDVSFDVEKGEVLGFLGPNGAGKTTTMRIITGYIEPSSGSVKVGEFDVKQNPEKSKSIIGYLPENAPLYRDMDVAGFLKFVAELRGLKGAAAKDAIAKVVEICHLDSVYYQSIDTLSKGYVRRAVLAQAIIHDPPVLILDEPTDGLDPNQKHEVRNMISHMGKDKAIIISTHILEEVDACCSRAIVIANGSLVANGTPAELKKMSPDAGSVVMDISGASFSSIRESLNARGGIQKISLVEDFGGRIKLRIWPAEGTAAEGFSSGLASFVVHSGLKLNEIYIDSGRLDEVFRQITKSEYEQRSR